MIQTCAVLARLHLPVTPVWSPSLLGARALPSHPIAALPEAEAPWGQSRVCHLAFFNPCVVKQMLRGQVYFNERGFFFIAENYTGLSNTFGSWKINAVTLSSNTKIWLYVEFRAVLAHKS